MIKKILNYALLFIIGGMSLDTYAIAKTFENRTTWAMVVVVQDVFNGTEQKYDIEPGESGIIEFNPTVIDDFKVILKKTVKNGKVFRKNDFQKKEYKFNVYDPEVSAAYADSFTEFGRANKIIFKEGIQVFYK